ncbi:MULTISPECIES: methionine/alanine import family NSS transporter small subunit [Nesterenkonia]|uniref:Putative methionine/alanine importer small subunit n=1 Tax=Nesterenkonia sandarakina TaxID=272918 RepID=A0A2T0YI62_9MICC|nr:methionine/alanine import family NSS transporter small subunit [Nesterenkonia sandarakina]PRZ14627.1 putative methionine/alanine importer small subunit [Nesterenkonia sandarakina]
METDALIMMIVALVTVWGGLVAAVVHLRRNPDSS